MIRIPLWGLLLAACRPAGPDIVSSEELGVIEQSPLIQGRDGGSSALLWGRSWWLYGDTVLDVSDEDGLSWHHNSASWTEDTTAADLISGFTEPLDSAGAPAHLIAPTEEERAFNLAHEGDDCDEEPCGARWAVWPGAPVWDEERQRAVVPYSLIYAEPGSLNFEGRGQSLAIWDDPEQPPVRVEPMLWGEDEPSWGEAALIDGAHLYLFACPKRGLKHRCQLARAPLDRVEDADQWRYRARDEWSADPDEATVLFDGAPIMSVSWSAHLGAFLVMYSPPLSRAVEARTAPTPWGPWSRSVVAHRTDEAAYDVVHHAEYEEDGGRVQFLSCSRPAGEGWFGTEFPLVAVTFE